MLSPKAQAIAALQRDAAFLKVLITVQKQDMMTQNNTTYNSSVSLSLGGVDLISRLVSSLQ